MKKPFGDLIIVSAIILVVVFIFSVQQPAKEQTQEYALQENTPEDFWVYTNTRLGFSMKIPNDIDLSSNDGSYRKFLTHVTVFDDNESSFVFIAPVHNYDQDFKNGFGLISFSEYFPGHTWKIDVGDIKNNSDLDKFVKEKIGPDCKFDSLRPTASSDLFNVHFVTARSYVGGPNDLNDSCGHSKMTIKYSPGAKKAAHWDQRQEDQFIEYWNDGWHPKKIFDQDMEESFRFIE